MLGVRCGGCRSVRSAGRWARLRACRLRVDLIRMCLPAGVLIRGVARKRRELNEPKSGVPTSVPITERKAFQMTSHDWHRSAQGVTHRRRDRQHRVCARRTSCPSVSKQTDQLRAWAAPFPDRVWAIESARGLGYLLAQQLVAAGETVVDVPAVLSTRTRSVGLGRAQKNDPNDARSVAIAALRTDGLARVGVDEHAQVLKLLAKRHRDLGRSEEQSSMSAACVVDGTRAGRDGQGNDRDQGKRSPRPGRTVDTR
jgi:hypothetical protein